MVSDLIRISLLTDPFVPSFAKSKSSAKKRPLEVLNPCVDAWVNARFLSSVKEKARDSAWPGLKWQYGNIKVIALKDILAELKHAAGKLAELIEYYNSMLKQPR